MFYFENEITVGDRAGGGREVVKRKGEQYKLIWKDDVDFVRLAAKCDAIIVPFAAVGADDAFDIFLDTDEILLNPILGPLASRISARVNPGVRPEDSIFPITKIPGTSIPSPFPISNFQRVYFKFGMPVDTRDISSTSDKEACMRMYQRVRQSVEHEIGDLLAVRSEDPDSAAIPRLQRYIGSFNPFSG